MFLLLADELIVGQGWLWHRGEGDEDSLTFDDTSFRHHYCEGAVFVINIEVKTCVKLRLSWWLTIRFSI